MGAQPPPIPYILGEGVNYLTLRVHFYANECKEGKTLTPNPNERNSTLTSGTKGIYLYLYIDEESGPCAKFITLIFLKTVKNSKVSHDMCYFKTFQKFNDTTLT